METPKYMFKKGDILTHNFGIEPNVIVIGYYNDNLWNRVFNRKRIGCMKVKIHEE